MNLALKKTSKTENSVQKFSWQLRAVQAILALEATFVLGVGCVDVYKTITGNPEKWLYSLIMGLIVCGVGILLATVSWQIGRRRWPNSVAVFCQLMALPVGWFMIHSPARWAGVIILVVCGATLILLINLRRRS